MSSSFPKGPTPPVTDAQISDALRALAKALEDGAIDPPVLPASIIPEGYDAAALYGALRNRDASAWSPFSILLFGLREAGKISMDLMNEVCDYFTDSGDD